MGVEGGERLTQLPGFASPFPMGVTVPASHIADIGAFQPAFADAAVAGACRCYRRSRRLVVAGQRRSDSSATARGGIRADGLKLFPPAKLGGWGQEGKRASWFVCRSDQPSLDALRGGRYPGGDLGPRAVGGSCVGRRDCGSRRPKECIVYENGVDRGRDEDGSVMEPGSAGGCPYSCSTESRVIRRLLLPDRTERVFSTDRC